MAFYWAEFCGFVVRNVQLMTVDFIHGLSVVQGTETWAGNSEGKFVRMHSKRI